MKIVNLTPHELNIYLPNGKVLTIKPSGTVARVRTSQMKEGSVYGIPVVRTQYLDVEGLPPKKEDTIYIASTLVTQIARQMMRNDVFAPDTGPQSAVRDETGRIIGVRRLQIF